MYYKRFPRFSAVFSPTIPKVLFNNSSGHFCNTGRGLHLQRSHRLLIVANDKLSAAQLRRVLILEEKKERTRAERALARATKRLNVSEIQATKNDTSSPLLRLPPELRNAIGRLVLLADGDFIIDYYEIQAAISILHTC